MSAIAPDKTAPRSPDTRDRLLRLTLELIGREGIAAITNRRLAAAAGVSLGSLTYHFPSQAALLRESLLLFVAEEVARLELIAAELRGRSPRPSAAEVAAEVQRIAVAGSERPEQVAELELHLHASRDPQLQDASRRCFAAYEDLATAALDALGVGDPARHAGAVVALLTGFGVIRLASGGRGEDRTAEALLTLLQGALAESD